MYNTFTRPSSPRPTCSLPHIHFYSPAPQPENILYATKDPDSPIKLSDFGVSRIVGEGSFMTTLCGTPEYLGMSLGQEWSGK